MQSVCLLTAAVTVPQWAQAQPAENVIRHGRFLISVRAAAAPETPTDTSDEWMKFFRPGVAYGALGAVAPPMFASGLIVGGLLLAPAALIMSGRERRIWESATQALGSVDFARDLARAMQARAAAALPAADDEPRIAVDVVVNAYGLAGATPHRACFIASVDLGATTPGQSPIKERLTIAQGERSVDAPPPQCASLERMAENEGRLVKSTAAEYAEVLAVMVLDRLAAGSGR